MTICMTPGDIDAFLKMCTSFSRVTRFLTRTERQLRIGIQYVSVTWAVLHDTHAEYRIADSPFFPP